MSKVELIKKTDLGFEYLYGKNFIWLTGGYVVSPIFNYKNKCIKPYEANNNEDLRQLVVTSIAAISRGKSKSNNPKKRYQMLLGEAVNNPLKIDKPGIKKVAGRPLEFIPVILDFEFMNNFVYIYEPDNYKQPIKILDYLTFANNLQKFGYSETLFLNYHRLYTNLRACLNTGISYNDIPYANEEIQDEYKKYKVMVIQAPHFVFDQLYTHSVFSKIAVSERVTKENHYYLPDDFLDRIEDARKNWADYEIDSDYIVSAIGDEIKVFKEKNTYDDAEKRKLLESIIESFLLEFTHEEIIEYFKDFGYKQEIYNRWSYGMKYKTFIMGAWINDPKTWNHLLLEREAYPELYKSWVQKETSIIASNIKDVLM